MFLRAQDRPVLSGILQIPGFLRRLKQECGVRRRRMSDIAFSAPPEKMSNFVKTIPLGLVPLSGVPK